MAETQVAVPKEGGPPHPEHMSDYSGLIIHCAQKSVQVGSFAGTVVSIPVSLYKTRSLKLGVILPYAAGGKSSRFSCLRKV